MNLMITLFVIFAMLQVADGYTTIRGLKKSGVTERNKLAAAFMRKIGVVPAVMVYKVGITVAIWYFLPQMQPWAMWLLIGIYSYVVYRNWQVAK